MDKKIVESKLAELDDKVDRLQEPIEQVFDAISALITDTNGTETADLLDFKIKLLEILADFSEKMATAHDEIIEDCENVETINKLYS